MRVLLTNRKLEARAGTELYLRDIALELRRQGHDPVVYSPHLGPVAEDFFDATIPVTDDLATLGSAPDIIHGQHHLPTMTALQWFHDAPAVSMSHGWRPWPEQPVIHPRVYRHLAVDEAVRDRLQYRHGLAAEQIDIVPNFVDLDRFTATAELNAEPRRMLLFSNYVSKGSAQFVAATEAAEALGLDLEVVGRRMGNVTDTPEELLGRFDVVCAQGRSAMEAIACGAAVIITSTRAFGPLVTAADLDRIRRLNFGIRTLEYPASSETLIAQLLRYDAADAARVSAQLRASAGVSGSVSHLTKIYEAVVDEHAGAALDRIAEGRATAAFLATLTADVDEAMLASARVPGLEARLARANKRRDRAVAAHNKLKRRVKRASVGAGAGASGKQGNSTKRAARRVAKLADENEELTRRLGELERSAAFRIQERVRASKALSKAYRFTSRTVRR